MGLLRFAGFPVAWVIICSVDPTARFLGCGLGAWFGVFVSLVRT